MSHFESVIYPIVLNQGNLVSRSDGAVYSYRFPQPVTFEKSLVSLDKISIFFSWFNITAENNNNTYQFIFTDGSGSTTYTVPMPDGYYSVSDLNTFLQSVMIDEGLFLVDADGLNVYYLEIVENKTFYSIQLNTFPFPTSLPAGYTNPNSLTFPATASTPQFVILDNAFQQIIGFNNATIPSAIQATTFSAISDFTPQVDTVQSLILACSLVKNKYAIPQTVLYSFSPSQIAFGGLIETSPTDHIFVPVCTGQYSHFEVTLLDQNFRRVKVNDTNLIIQLLIETAIE